MDELESNAGSGSASALEALERFVVDNDELLELVERIGRFNIFDALGIVNAEIRHSNFLAWLLDPAESHGQGALFLKAILMDLLRQSPPELRPFSPVLLDGEELRGVEVRREWKHIDLLITCQEPRFVIAIENKVWSKEGTTQLGRYKKAVQDEFGAALSQFVFLTREGDEPSDHEWTPYTYRDVHAVLSRVRNSNVASIGDDVLTFLDHYLSLIGSRFMDDPKIDELCRTIYKNHRRALQLIFDRIGITTVKADLAPLVASHEAGFVVYRSKGKTFAFQPKQWREWIPAIGLSRRDPKRWFAFRLGVFGSTLRLTLRMDRVRNEELRQKLYEALQTHATDCGLKGFKKGRPGGKRFPLHREVVHRWVTDEPDPAELTNVVKIRLDQILSDFAGVPSVLRPIVERWEQDKQDV